MSSLVINHSFCLRTSIVDITAKCFALEFLLLLHANTWPCTFVLTYIIQNCSTCANVTKMTSCKLNACEMSCSLLSKMGETNFLALVLPQTLTQRPILIFFHVQFISRFSSYTKGVRGGLEKRDNILCNMKFIYDSAKERGKRNGEGGKKVGLLARLDWI